MIACFVFDICSTKITKGGKNIGRLVLAMVITIVLVCMHSD